MFFISCYTFISSSRCYHASLNAFHKIRIGIEQGSNSLGARDGFIQPIFYKRFDHFSLLIRQNAFKKTVVSCDVTGE